VKITRAVPCRARVQRTRTFVRDEIDFDVVNEQGWRLSGVARLRTMSTRQFRTSVDASDPSRGGRAVRLRLPLRPAVPIGTANRHAVF